MELQLRKIQKLHKLELLSGLRIGASEGEIRIGGGAAALPFADMGVQFHRLPERHSDRGAVSLNDSLAPQHKHIDALIGQTVRPQGPCNPSRRVLRAPWLHPWPNPLLKARHNLIGDFIIKIGFHWLSPFKTGLRLQPV